MRVVEAQQLVQVAASCPTLPVVYLDVVVQLLLREVGLVALGPADLIGT